MNLIMPSAMNINPEEHECCHLLNKVRMLYAVRNVLNNNFDSLNGVLHSFQH